MWQPGRQPQQFQGLCFGGAQSRNIFGRLGGEKSSLGLVKSWQTGGSVGSRSAMKSNPGKIFTEGQICST